MSARILLNFVGVFGIWFILSRTFELMGDGDWRGVAILLALVGLGATALWLSIKGRRR